MDSIGIIGTGNMGGAIAKGLKTRNPLYDVSLLDADEEKAKQFAEQISADHFSFSEMEDFFKKCGIIILAVKPQHLPGLFRQIGSLGKNKKIISVAAGKTLDFFSRNIGSDQVIRFMPNIAAIYSSSIVAISSAESVTESFLEEAREIAESIGNYIMIPENLMAAFTGLSGSGIAYVLQFLHALAMGGTEMGIAYKESLDIAVSTMEGALALLKNGEESPVGLVTRVTSAGGTTIAGIKALEKGRMTYTVMEAVRKASERAEELEN